MNRWICMIACAVFYVSCSDSDDGPESTDRSNGTGTGTGSTPSAAADSSGSLLDFDITWDDVSDSGFTDATETVITDSSNEEYDDYVENSTFGSQVKIAFSGTSASVTNAVSGVSVSTSGGHVTVNSSASGVEYVLSGSTTNGSLKVYSEKKFKLTLSGVTITSGEGAAINIQSSKRAFIEIADGTENVLTDASDYTNTGSDEDQKACLFSEGQIIFNGSGSLAIYGNYKHGICSDEYVRLRGGNHITVASAVKDGIHTNEGIIMGGGFLGLTPSGDGLDCEEGSIDIRGGLLKANISGTASKAVKAETDISITGGRLLLLTSGEAEYDSDDKDISSPAGIKCGGNLTMSDAEVSIKSTGSAGKGINSDGTISITDCALKVITLGGQYVYGSLDSSPKGIKADGNLTVQSGTVWVKTTGGDGSEGIESKSTMTINDGEVSVYAYDDCLNASSGIVINGGDIYCYSSGNDGIDSNGTLTITGGTIVVSGATSPEEGFDCETNTFKITGGTLIGIGGGTSTPTSNVCSQRSVIYGGSGNSGTLLTFTAADGTHVMSYTIPRAYSAMTVLFSSAALTSGTSYVVYTGGSVSGGTEFYGLTTGGAYTGGTQANTFTVNSMVTTVNVSSGGPGNMGGGGGGWHW